MADKSPTGLAEPDVGSYFVATYPPFSVWSAEAVERDAKPALQAPPDAATPLGLYLHIPFCRKRCHFCYFRVYTDKNAQEIGRYLDILAKEWEMYARQPAIAGRPPNFVYFGGGTPSFLSTPQLQGLVKRLTAVTSWNHAEEITFECEPGTLTEHNGRAHRSPEIETAYRFARSLEFPQINIDLIAGMLGETDENWQRNIEKTVALEPDSITIYQMELPYNTTISKDLLQKTGQMTGSLAGWDTKRRWVEGAFAALERAGYHIGSAYTAVKDPRKTTFIYRDRLWQGADMAGLGVASFGHVNGVHIQNKDTWESYSEAVDRGELPLARAYRPTADERMRRELILQLKLGRLRPAYFADKYQVDIVREFAAPFASLRAEGYLTQADPDAVALSRDGLLRVDSLLPRFFRPEHTNIRYT